jgi:DNA modification methylase
MDGQKADLVFTDPPYNVDYEGYTEEKLKIQGDKMTPQQFQEFLLTVFRSYLWALKPGGSIYVCHPSSWQREFQGAIEAADFEVRCQIIWAKNTFAWGFGRYKFQHEPIFYCHSKAGDLILDLFGGSGSTLIACEKIGRSSRQMELDPKYCDVIVKRWQEFTGKTAHLEDGCTFAELETTRQKKQVP